MTYTVRVYASTFGPIFMVYTPIGTKVYEARTRAEVNTWIDAHPYINRCPVT